MAHDAAKALRIMTWNVNGIKTLPQYHPCVDVRPDGEIDAHSWNAFRKNGQPYEGILDHLGADIICIQETKITRDKIERAMVCMDKYDSYFSSYRRPPVKGYSGTAIFTRREACVATKAEEGLSGALQTEPKAVVPSGDRLGCYPSLSSLDLSTVEARDLDLEGRTTIIDVGLFVLINLYCPNQTNDVRLEFKLQFQALLQARIEAFVKAGREVIVLGDINVCASSMDHFEPKKRAKDHGLDTFEEHSARKWLRELTSPTGLLIDTCRHFFPTRWETKISARETNMGSRIDYVLVTPGLMPWIERADILPDITGSDHCPVFVDLKSELVDEETGEITKLWDRINPPARVALAQSGDTAAVEAFVPPPFAGRYYEEFSGKQRSLKSFFVQGAPKTKRTVSDSPAPKPTPSESPAPPPTEPSPVIALDEDDNEPSIDDALAALRSSSPVVLKTTSQPIASTSKSSAPHKASSQPVASSKTNGKSIKSKGDISAFFIKPPKPVKSKGKAKAKQVSPEDAIDVDDASSVDSGRDEPLPSAIVNEKAVSAWQGILQPKKAPLCEGHNEPCKQLQVNKAGENKGRRFWICSRPVGEGYDKGQPKSMVNPEYRCKTFIWDVAVKRPSDLFFAPGESASKKPRLK